jgi:outer membrane biosynthesis protein TonB
LQCVAIGGPLLKLRNASAAPAYVAFAAVAAELFVWGVLFGYFLPSIANGVAPPASAASSEAVITVLPVRVAVASDSSPLQVLDDLSAMESADDERSLSTEHDDEEEEKVDAEEDVKEKDDEKDDEKDNDDDKKPKIEPIEIPKKEEEVSERQAPPPPSMTTTTPVHFPNNMPTKTLHRSTSISARNAQQPHHTTATQRLVNSPTGAASRRQPHCH